MSGKQCFQRLIKTLEGPMQSSGFKWDRQVQGFARKDGKALHVLQLRFIPTDGGRVVPAVGVRLDDVEAIFHRTSGFDARSARKTVTIGAEVSRLLGGGPLEFTVGREEELPATRRRVLALFEETAKPYFAENSSVEAVDRLLNDKPASKSPHRPLEWLHAATGMIAGRLTGRPDLNELEAIYRDRVGQIDRGFYLPRFEALVADLKGGPGPI